MPHQITRAVHILSAAYGTSMAVKTGKTTVGQVASSVFYSKQHFPKILGSLIVLSGVVGWQTMAYIKNFGEKEELLYAE